jgi:pimeloyl-ACP methyl ester carboxylesterase
MTHDRIVEDRVFGLPGTFPPLPIVTKPSTSFDLMSVSVEGSEVVYAAQGTVNHPPLVFLHGWGASHKWWRWAFSAFAPRYRCIAPDFPGFGLSEKPRRDYSMEAYAAWLGKFLDALGFPRVTLVAHSMGGTVAFLFALDHPGRLEKLALVNPLLRGADAFNRRTRFLMLPVIRGLAYLMAKSPALRRKITRDFSFVRPLEPELAEDVAKGTYASSIETMLSLLRIDLTPRLSSLQVPTLAVGTDKDQIIITPQYDWVPAERKALLPETGHIPIIERPAQFNAILDEFLRNC